ncbi:hypothetical protein EDB92DRAFT_1951687 [Lactarius akahatsu]|uniref:Uncharacterized protein n=1 Tax=Lactarius akahatsu TaxID=416441 RepID=A0AAD4LDU7_9AGAM|nr:hypothetical protein EDB92DRAFT_1951687 [Lactarius akahatsu]
MALGSTKHLQHYFTKMGHITNFRSNAQRKGLISAIGSCACIGSNLSLGSLPEHEHPPSLALPAASSPPFKRYVATSKVDPETSSPAPRTGSTQHHWPGHTTPSSSPDVLRSTHAIRSVRNYLNLDEHDRTQPRQRFLPTLLSTSEPQKRRVSSGTDPTNPLVHILCATLNVLTVLPQLEESAHLPDKTTGGPFSASVMRAGGRRELILEDEFEESGRVLRAMGRAPSALQRVKTCSSMYSPAGHRR